MYRRDRIGKKGGGMLVYVNNRLISSQRDDLMSTDCEILWLEVYPFKSKRPILVASVDRPPSSKRQDDINIGVNLENAYLLNLETIIMGDFNIDILKPDHNKHKLFKFLKNLHLTQLVNEVTRPISGAYLDHLWVSHPERIASVEAKLCGLSDHLPITAMRKYNNTSKVYQGHKSIKYRDFKNMDAQGFVQSLKEAPWDTAFIFNDIDDIYDTWLQIFSDILNEFPPVNEKRVKRKSQPAWFTSELNKMIIERNKLLNKARKSKRAEDWSLFMASKNRVTRVIRLNKKDYFKTQVAENRNNPKKLWKLIKNLSRENHNKLNLINQLVDKNGNQYSDAQQMADLLNAFYVNQPRDLLESISLFSSGGSCDDTADLTCSTSQIDPSSIPHISEAEVRKAISSMPEHKATGADGISTKILKMSAPAISSSLARIISYCIDNSCVPSAWKLAKVNPIYKGKGS